MISLSRGESTFKERQCDICGQTTWDYRSEDAGSSLASATWLLCDLEMSLKSLSLRFQVWKMKQGRRERMLSRSQWKNESEYTWQTVNHYASACGWDCDCHCSLWHEVVQILRSLQAPWKEAQPLSLPSCGRLLWYRALSLTWSMSTIFLRSEVRRLAACCMVKPLKFSMMQNPLIWVSSFSSSFSRMKQYACKILGTERTGCKT